jgi:hypothetical protein
MQTPATLKESLDTAFLRHVVDALLPPEPLRAASDLDVEVEAAGEGTFTVSLRGRQITAQKGFADEPLLSIQIPRGGFALVRRQLDAALAGFPQAPELARASKALRAPRPGDFDAVVSAFGKLPDVAVHIDVKGQGRFVVSRGPADEAAHVLEVRVDGTQLDALLEGASVSSLKPTLSGDRAVLPQVLAALSPLTRLVSG